MFFFSESYRAQRRKLIGHLLRLTDQTPEKSCAFHANVPHPWLNPIRKVGQPRANWILEAMGSIWEEVHDPGQPLEHEQYAFFDMDSHDHVQTMNLIAHMRLL